VTDASRRWWRPLLGLAISGFFLFLLSRQVDLAQLGTALSQISPGSLAVAVGFLAVGYTIRIIRWWWMLRALDPQLRLGGCAWPFLVSIAANNLLPFRAGDALRVVGFRQQLRAPPMRLLGTLVIERLLDLQILLALFFLGLAGVPEGGVPDTLIHAATWIAAAGLVAVLGVLLFSRPIEAVVHWLATRPYLAAREWSDLIKRHSGHFFDALSILRSSALTLQLIALTCLAWLAEGAVFVTIAHAFGAESSPAAPWFALATGTLSTLLPSSPGYVGTFDYFAMLGFAAYGTERESAAAIAVAIHLVLWLPLTALGIAYLLWPNARILRRQVTAIVSGREKAT
jgi:glycosyltransferase 2 family protein